MLSAAIVFRPASSRSTSGFVDDVEPRLSSRFLGIKRATGPHGNDNPYSEAGFKTMKDCPAFPGSFG